MATDYDAPRKNEEDQSEESIEELKARRHDKNSGKVDEDEAEAAESFAPLGIDPPHGLQRAARGRKRYGGQGTHRHPEGEEQRQPRDPEGPVDVLVHGPRLVDGCGKSGPPP